MASRAARVPRRTPCAKSPGSVRISLRSALSVAIQILHHPAQGRGALQVRPGQALGRGQVLLDQLLHLTRGQKAALPLGVAGPAHKAQALEVARQGGEHLRQGQAGLGQLQSFGPVRVTGAGQSGVGIGGGPHPALEPCGRRAEVGGHRGFLHLVRQVAHLPDVCFVNQRHGPLQHRGGHVGLGLPGHRQGPALGQQPQHAGILLQPGLGEVLLHHVEPGVQIQDQSELDGEAGRAVDQHRLVRAHDLGLGAGRGLVLKGVLVDVQPLVGPDVLGLEVRPQLAHDDVAPVILGLHLVIGQELLRRPGAQEHQVRPGAVGREDQVGPGLDVGRDVGTGAAPLVVPGEADLVLGRQAVIHLEGDVFLTHGQGAGGQGLGAHPLHGAVDALLQVLLLHAHLLFLPGVDVARTGGIDLGPGPPLGEQGLGGQGLLGPQAGGLDRPLLAAQLAHHRAALDGRDKGHQLLIAHGDVHVDGVAGVGVTLFENELLQQPRRHLDLVDGRGQSPPVKKAQAEGSVHDLSSFSPCGEGLRASDRHGVDAQAGQPLQGPYLLGRADAVRPGKGRGVELAVHDDHRGLIALAGVHRLGQHRRRLGLAARIVAVVRADGGVIVRGGVEHQAAVAAGVIDEAEAHPGAGQAALTVVSHLLGRRAHRGFDGDRAGDDPGIGQHHVKGGERPAGVGHQLLIGHRHLQVQAHVLAVRVLAQDLPLGRAFSAENGARLGDKGMAAFQGHRGQAVGFNSIVPNHLLSSCSGGPQPSWLTRAAMLWPVFSGWSWPCSCSGGSSVSRLERMGTSVLQVGQTAVKLRPSLPPSCSTKASAVARLAASMTSCRCSGTLLSSVVAAARRSASLRTASRWVRPASAIGCSSATWVCSCSTAVVRWPTTCSASPIWTAVRARAWPRGAKAARVTMFLASAISVLLPSGWPSQGWPRFAFVPGWARARAPRSAPAQTRLSSGNSSISEAIQRTTSPLYSSPSRAKNSETVRSGWERSASPLQVTDPAGIKGGSASIWRSRL
eukprot:TRINITY_DN13819_c0_g1_i3.p1 TRINITY_DN13819_c0_g1~~TRINITY_DN13819_c0_g1_i3.p1  ORF type:complete len:1014 (+),score=314.85 TRINITY_DN13819_c0_g1_i3:1127-4168(+)